MQPAKGKVLIAASAISSLFSIVKESLHQEGYEVFFCKWEELIKTAKHIKPIIVIINVHQSNINDFYVCKSLRTLANFDELGILLTCAEQYEEIIIKWIEAGADNYVINPFNSKILVTRISTLSKRLTVSSANQIVIGDLMIDREKYVVTYKNEEVTLTLKEFEVLLLLTNKVGKITFRDDILNLVWGGDASMRMVDLHIHKIRQKLGSNLIKTVKGIGYKLQSLTAVPYAVIFVLSFPN